MSFYAKDFDDACADHRRTWAALDAELYGVCRRHPRHTDIGGVRAKLWLIGRTFATGIERQIDSDGQQGGAMAKLAKHLCGQACKVDAILGRARKVAEPLDEPKLKAIALAHGQFMKLLDEVVRRGKSPRSFVSKYLHFHCPSVPIYDSWAAASLRKLRPWKLDFRLFDPPEQADEEYCWYLMRFWRLYRDARRDRPGATVRLLDYYLLCRRGQSDG